MAAGSERDILWRVLGWRVATSVAWSVLLLPAWTAAFVLFSGIDLFHPIQWISDSVHDLYSSYVIFCVLLLSGVTLAISVFHVEFYAVVPSPPCSRLTLLGKMLLPQQVLHSLAHAVMGVLVAWCAAVLAGRRYRFLSVPCTAPESAAPQACLNESHLLILLAGAFMGYSYSLRYFADNLNYLPFPIIQQCKFLRFRRSLAELLRQSCGDALYLVRNFCFLYYFLGYIPKAWMSAAVGLQTDPSLQPLDSVSGLLDLSLLCNLWLCGVFLLVVWRVAWMLFKIYATEAHIFPVQPAFAEESDECLPKVLNSNAPLIIKFLALQDLMLLSQYSPLRRQEVFSLSQPGGHPHHWTAICTACLTLLDGLSQKLLRFQEAAATNGRVKSRQSPERPQAPNPAGPATPRAMRSSLVPRTVMPLWAKASPLAPPAELISPLGSPFGSTVVTRLVGGLDATTQLARRAPRLWTSVSDPQASSSLEPPFPPSPSAPTGEKGQEPSALYTWLQTKQEQVRGFLSKRALIVYFFSKHPEASIQAAFTDAQMHIWALEGLSHLVAASFTEDRFGVVQTSLPAILNTLLTLQEAVDKHFKLPHASSKPPRAAGASADTSFRSLRFALRAALKTALYRITTTFGQHLTAVQASAEHQKRLQLFLEFKE
ncbi:nucleoporin NDC1 [Tachyglossus aculeatus]|uniref:nucleoporin NDC1 n=1 Tax=Tachyglossus aculeatus TaxID=9261 RepID=UPI0018F3FFB3|nr:nucleoporin NDC1 [Tachyglossus aculeatus]